MADITITVNSITPSEARAAQFVLARENASRTELGLATFPNAQAFLADRINNWLLPQWIQMEREANEETSSIKDRWLRATDAQRAAALAELPAP